MYLAKSNLRYQSCRELLRDLNNYEKLNQKYQKRNKKRKGFIKGAGKVIRFTLLVMLVWMLIRDKEWGGVLKEKIIESFDRIKNAEKPEWLSAFQELLDFFLQKVYHFFNSQRSSLYFLSL